MEKLGTCRHFSGRLAAFHLQMKGPALTWYNGLKTNAETKWDDVKTLFIDKYVRGGWQHPSVVIENEIFHIHVKRYTEDKVKENQHDICSVVIGIAMMSDKTIATLKL